MTFPLKFKPRLELKKAGVAVPGEAWITYAVCGCQKDSCGWEGWILECVRRTKGKATEQLPIDSSQRCPNCRKPLFRTEVSYRFTRAAKQTPDLIPHTDYRVAKMRYAKTA
jgi:hypothetical protein